MATDVQGLINAGTVAELERKGYTVVTGGGHTIAVFAYDDKVYALDNRCPHMGFPLSQGTVRDGILTCHWHHARFDLASGDTFDLFAGDTRCFPVQVVDGQAWVDPSLSAEDRMEYWKQRFVDGLEHNIRLVIARSVIGMMQAGADYREPLETGALFGARYSADGWSAAMSILTACANMLPQLRPEDRPLAIYHGLFHIAEECAGRPPRFLIGPLSVQNPEPARLKEWFRSFVEVRDQEAAERTLRTAIDVGLPPEAVADMVFAAITDHLFVDGGHTIDFANKAFELLGHIGWQHAGIVLTSLVPQMMNASRSEESSAWRHPTDVSSLLFAAYEELPTLWTQGQRAEAPWQREEELVETVLQDDPAATVEALKVAVAAGATPDELGAAVTHAAFLRLTRYHLSNEFADWNIVHHCVTTANAVHQALRRAPSVELLRGVFDSAISIYHARFPQRPRCPGPSAQRPHRRWTCLRSDAGGAAWLDGPATAGRRVGPGGRSVPRRHRSRGTLAGNLGPRHAQRRRRISSVPDGRGGPTPVSARAGESPGPDRAHRRGALLGGSFAHFPVRWSDISYRLPVRARRPDIPGRLGAWFQDCQVIPARPGGYFWRTPQSPGTGALPPCNPGGGPLVLARAALRGRLGGITTWRWLAHSVCSDA